jgi:hypothetical protein
VNYRERSLIADFTGLPIIDSPYKNRHPKNIAVIIDQVWDSWKIGTEVSPEQKISENWEKLVGHKFASRCAPEKLDLEKGILTIRSASSTVKQELVFKKKGLIKKITALDSSFTIKDLRIL